jgi:hypothetical protein
MWASRRATWPVWGQVPFQEAAFIGGASTVRGLYSDRYAGDASAYGNAELRFHLFDSGYRFRGSLVCSASPMRAGSG